MPYLHQEVNRLYFVSSFKGQDLFQTQGIISMFFESHLKVSLLDTQSIFKFQSTDLGEWESNDSQQPPTIREILEAACSLVLKAGLFNPTIKTM